MFSLLNKCVAYLQQMSYRSYMNFLRVFLALTNVKKIQLCCLFFVSFLCKNMFICMCYCLKKFQIFKNFIDQISLTTTSNFSREDINIQLQLIILTSLRQMTNLLSILPSTKILIQKQGKEGEAWALWVSWQGERQGHWAQRLRKIGKM